MHPLKVTSLEKLTETSQNYAIKYRIEPHNIFEHYIDYQRAKEEHHDRELELSEIQLATGIIIASELIHHHKIKLPISISAWKKTYATISRDKTLIEYEEAQKRYMSTIEAIPQKEYKGSKNDLF